MKKIILGFAAICFMASCQNNNTTSGDAKESGNATETKAASNGPKDPVCKMDKESTWTDYTVQNNDTVWFCSEHCKTAFLEHPEKYTAQK